MAIEWEDITPVEIAAGDKLMTIRGSGAGATPRLVTAGTAAVRDVGTGAGNIPVLGSDGKLSADRLPVSALTPLRQPAASFADSFVLEAGRIGYETDTQKFKLGDGATVWSSLPYAAAGVSSFDDLADIPDALAAAGGLTPAANRYVLYTGEAAASMATISVNGQSLVAAADYAAMKALLDLEIGTDLEAFSAFSTNANAAVTLLPAHNRARIRFTHATPVLSLALQADQTYPDGFVMWGRAPSGMTIDAPAGVTLNGTDGLNVTIGPSTTGGGFKLSRDASNAWTAEFSPILSAFALTMLDDADAAAVRTTLGLGTAALLDAEDRETATCYDIIARRADGMMGTGVAADLLVSGTQTLTPVAGAITHLYPLDPATSTELPEVAEDQANRPLNAVVSLTSANSDGDEFELIYPNPVDSAVLAGMENRVSQTRLINDDEAATLTIKLAAYAPGLRLARWRGSLTDVTLDPGDELLARAFWFNGDLDVDQFLRTASYATIEVVTGSAGTSTSPTGRPTPNALTGDLILQQVVRVGGQSISLPSGLGYTTPTGLPYGSDGRLLQPTPNRATRVAWTTATADGTHASGAFSGATARSISAAYRNVAAVRQVSAAYGDASTSIAWPALPGPRAPNSWVVGVLNATGLSAAVSPSLSTEDTDYDAGAGSTVTSLSLWHYAAGEAYAPSPTTVTSCNWACTVLELTPRRLS